MGSILGLMRCGKCQHCGACCKWKVARGLKMFQGRRDEQREWCPYYMPELKRCSIYETRPEGCRDHPRTPAEVFEGCGFSFKETQ